MLPPSTTRSDGFSIGNPLFHELQMVAKRDSPLGTMYSFCSQDAIHGPVHKKKRRLDGGCEAPSRRASPGEGEGAPCIIRGDQTITHPTSTRGANLFPAEQARLSGVHSVSCSFTLA